MNVNFVFVSILTKQIDKFCKYDYSRFRGCYLKRGQLNFHLSTPRKKVK